MWGVVIHLLREGPGAFTYGLTWPSGAVEDGARSKPRHD